MRAIRDRVVELRRVRASELLADPRNWRRHPAAQQRALRSMLADVGYADALLARETPEGLRLIDGHLRAETTPDEVVPVLVLDVDEEEAGRLLASVDPLAGMAVADPDALADLLAAVSISDGELLEHLRSMAGIRGFSKGLTDPDHVPPLPTEPRTRPGDLWVMGEHRLVCGDATERSDAARLGSPPEALVLSDPPYNVGLDYGPGIDDAKSEADYEAFTRAWVDMWITTSERAIVTPGCNNLGPWLRWFEPYHVAPWTKTNAMTNGKVSRWWCWEPVLFFGTGWPRERPNDVFDFPVGDQSSAGIGSHPCPKPAVMWRDLLATYGSGAVVDPFLGSGTTLIVAELEDQTCYGMELSPSFCDVAMTRWEAFTAQEAVLERG